MTNKERLALWNRWMQGRSLMHQKAGLDPRQAFIAALNDWHKHEKGESQ